MHELSIKGEEKPLTILLRAWRNGTVPHSLLFTGIRGIGKFTTAMWYAALLTCTRPGDSAPCGECPSCRKIHSGNHPDVRAIEPDQKTLHLKIDQIRALQREAAYKPAEGARKIFIIDGAHRMNEAAANCLLKMLEEPPPGLHCILISPAIYSLLPTIISRCQVVKFLPVEAEITEKLLMERGVTAERARVYSHLAQGSVGKAIEMAEKERLWESRKTTLALLADIPSMEAGKVLLAVDSFPKEREDIELLLELVLIWMRDLLLVKETGAEDLVINRDLAAAVRNAAGGLSPWQIITCIAGVREAMENLRAQVTPSIVMERLFLSLHKVQSALTIA